MFVLQTLANADFLLHAQLIYMHWHRQICRNGAVFKWKIRLKSFWFSNMTISRSYSSGRRISQVFFHGSRHFSDVPADLRIGTPVLRPHGFTVLSSKWVFCCISLPEKNSAAIFICCYLCIEHKQFGFPQLVYITQRI